MTFTSHKIPVTGGIVGSLLFGTDETRLPVININGGPGGTYLDETHALKDLDPDRRIVLYDQLGSYNSPADFDMSLTPMTRFVDELHAVLDYYGFEKTILLGHSFGGTIALDFAVVHPNRVAGLILSSPLISTPRWIADANALLDQMPDNHKLVIRRQLGGETVDDIAYDSAEMEFYHRHLCRVVPWPPRLLEAFSKGNKKLYDTMWGRSEFVCTGTLKNYDRFPDLKNLHMPTLLIHGEYDEVSLRTMQDAQNAFPTPPTLVTLENASHCPLVENKDAYFAALTAFFQGCDRA